MGDEGYFGAGGEQPAQIITPSSGMEGEKLGGQARERFTLIEKDREGGNLVTVKNSRSVCMYVYMCVCGGGGVAA